MPKVTVRIEAEIEFDAVRISAAPRYPEEDCPGIPFLEGELWNVTIDLLPDGGAKIRNWPGPAFDLHTKVCDQGSYYLLQGEKAVWSTEDNYVPPFMPGEHYGDYIIMDIDEDGTVLNWDATDRDWQATVATDND